MIKKNIPLQNPKVNSILLMYFIHKTVQMLLINNQKFASFYVMNIKIPEDLGMKMITQQIPISAWLNYPIEVLLF